MSSLLLSRYARELTSGSSRRLAAGHLSFGRDEVREDIDAACSLGLRWIRDVRHKDGR
jgi:hypothetical protein